MIYNIIETNTYKNAGIIIPSFILKCFTRRTVKHKLGTLTFLNRRSIISTLILIAFLTTNANSSPIINKSQQTNTNKASNFKSTCKSLYRVKSAEKLEELTFLKKELHKANATSIDLRQMTRDLCMLFNDTTDIYDLYNTIPSRMLFGNRVEAYTGYSNVSGFVPTSEVAKIVKWIKINKIDSESGFIKLYDNASAEVKEEIENRGTPKKDVLYKYYVKPLINFYLDALNEKNSIVITGE